MKKSSSTAASAAPSSARPGILRSIALGVAASALLTGCGAIYYPVYAPSEQALLVKDDERFPYDLQIVNLTIASAQEANVRWPYQPRPVPPILQGALVPSLSQAYAPGRLAQADGPVQAYATSQSTSLPVDDITSYKIGKGDVLQIANVAGNDQAATNAQMQNTYLVDQQGRVFVPQLDYIDVLGKDVQQVRTEVLERMKKVFISPVALVNVTSFKSQNYSITGRSIRPISAPVTMQPVTLREALLQVAATSTIYDEATVELVRDGRRYSVPYSDVAYNGVGARTIMRDGDQVIIRDPSGEGAQQAELRRTLESVNLDTQRIDLQRQQISAAEFQSRLSQQQLDLTRNSDQRAEETLRLTQERLDLDRLRLEREEAASRRADETLSLARQRELREADALRLQQLREAREDRAFELQQLREEREAQTLELQRLREQREASALDLQRARGDREATTLELSAAREERERAALDLQRQRLQQDLQEYTLREGQFDLQRQDQILRERADARGRATLEISRLTTSQALNALDRDHVFVTGEVGQTVRMPMPYGSSLSLADALYQAKGIDPISGDPSGVHVVRTENGDSVRAKVYIFKLDAQNIANLSAATVFKMRPDDVLYVTPQPVTNWNRTLTQILGGTNALVGAATRGIGG